MTTRAIRVTVTTFFLLISCEGFADWAIGGGELIRHSQNPWFIQNTASVTYCIISDEVNMGQTSNALKAIVSQTLDFWTKITNPSLYS